MSTWMTCRALLRRAAWIALCLPALARADGEPRYEVHNTGTIPLSFATMDPARGTWKDQSIGPNERKSLVWRSGANQGKIRIATEGRGHVQYDVQAGHRYSVVWDDRKGVWDFRSTGMLAAAPATNGAPPARFTQVNATPQQQVQPQQASWTLNNRSNERLAFQTLDPARGTWKDQVSYPHQPASYTMTPGVTAGKIRIATQDRGYVQYDVVAGGNYALHWNRDKGVWDLRSVRSGG